MARLHASCVLIGEAGLLVLGASGSGKSDLVLRLIDGGGRLVADDQVLLSAEDGRLVARPPENLAGLMEVRGLGIVRFDHVAEAPVGLLAELVQQDDVERMPEPESREIDGVALPLIRILPFDASAPAKLRLAMAVLCDDIGRIMR